MSLIQLKSKDLVGTLQNAQYFNPKELTFVLRSALHLIDQKIIKLKEAISLDKKLKKLDKLLHYEELISKIFQSQAGRRSCSLLKEKSFKECMYNLGEEIALCHQELEKIFEKIQNSEEVNLKENLKLVKIAESHQSIFRKFTHAKENISKFSKFSTSAKYLINEHTFSTLLDNFKRELVKKILVTEEFLAMENWINGTEVLLKALNPCTLYFLVQFFNQLTPCLQENKKNDVVTTFINFFSKIEVQLDEPTLAQVKFFVSLYSSFEAISLETLERLLHLTVSFPQQSFEKYRSFIENNKELLPSLVDHLETFSQFEMLFQLAETKGIPFIKKLLWESKETIDLYFFARSTLPGDLLSSLDFQISENMDFAKLLLKLIKEHYTRSHLPPSRKIHLEMCEIFKLLVKDPTLYPSILKIYDLLILQDGTSSLFNLLSLIRKYGNALHKVAHPNLDHRSPKSIQSIMNHAENKELVSHRFLTMDYSVDSLISKKPEFTCYAEGLLDLMTVSKSTSSYLISLALSNQPESLLHFFLQLASSKNAQLLQHLIQLSRSSENAHQDLLAEIMQLKEITPFWENLAELSCRAFAQSLLPTFILIGKNGADDPREKAIAYCIEMKKFKLLEKIVSHSLDAPWFQYPETLIYLFEIDELLTLKAPSLREKVIAFALEAAKSKEYEAIYGRLIFLLEFSPKMVSQFLARKNMQEIDQAIMRKIDAKMNEYMKRFKGLKIEEEDRRTLHQAAFSFACASVLMCKNGIINVGAIEILRNHSHYQALPKSSGYKEWIDYIFDSLKNDESFRGTFCTIQKSTSLNTAAENCIRRDLDLSRWSRITEYEIRLAILTSILTQLRQGSKTGECFAVANIIHHDWSLSGLIQAVNDYSNMFNLGCIIRKIDGHEENCTVCDQGGIKEGEIAHHDNELLHLRVATLGSLAEQGREKPLFEKINAHIIHTLLKGEQKEIIEAIEGHAREKLTSCIGYKFFPNATLDGKAYGNWKLLSFGQLPLSLDELKKIYQDAMTQVMDRLIFESRGSQYEAPLIRLRARIPKEIETSLAFTTLPDYFKVANETMGTPIQFYFGHNGVMTFYKLQAISRKEAKELSAIPQNGEEALKLLLYRIWELPLSLKEKILVSPSTRLLFFPAQHALNLIPGKDPKLIPLLRNEMGPKEIFDSWLEGEKRHFQRELNHEERAHLEKAIQSDQKFPANWKVPLIKRIQQEHFTLECLTEWIASQLDSRSQAAPFVKRLQRKANLLSTSFDFIDSNFGSLFHEDFVFAYDPFDHKVTFNYMVTDGKGKLGKPYPVSFGADPWISVQLTN